MLVTEGRQKKAVGRKYIKRRQRETEAECQAETQREKQRLRQTHTVIGRWRGEGDTYREIGSNAGCVFCIPRDHLLSIDTVLEDRVQQGFIGQNLSSLHSHTHTQSLQAIFL